LSLRRPAETTASRGILLACDMGVWNMFPWIYWDPDMAEDVCADLGFYGPSDSSPTDCLSSYTDATMVAKEAAARSYFKDPSVMENQCVWLQCTP
jgi:hypothetical protein